MEKIIPHQYKPFNYQIGNIQVIIYPIKNTGDIHALVANKEAIRQHLNTLYKIQDEAINRGLFHIIFVWAWRGLLMTDIWIHQPNTMDTDVGGEIGIEKCLTFKGYEPYLPIGIASDNSAVVLGREQEHRWKFESIDEYIDRSKSMPVFPEGFTPVEEF